ncbi:hypothetical protein D3C87_459940 [compost metagenome]
MKVQIDSNLVRHVKFTEVKNRGEWYELVAQMAHSGCRPNHSAGPSIFPCLVVQSTAPLSALTVLNYEVNIEFIYNYTILPEEELKAAA